MRGATLVETWRFPTPEVGESSFAAPLEDGRSLLDYARVRAAIRPAVRDLGQRLRSVSATAYEAMSDEARAAFNDARLALLNHELIAKTRSVDELRGSVIDLMEGQQRFLRGGYYVAGPAGVGKTTAMTDALAAAIERHYRRKFGPDWWRRDPSEFSHPWRNAAGDVGGAREVLIVPMMMPVRPTAREISLKLLAALSAAVGDPTISDEVERSRSLSKVREARITDVLIERMRIHGVRIIAIDELHFVRGDAKGTEVVDHLKQLMNRTRAGLVLAGVSTDPADGLKIRQRGRTATDDQLRRRFTTIGFAPFAKPSSHGSKKGQEWAHAVSQLASTLVLLEQDPGWWADSKTLTYLWERTEGVFADLAQLIRKAGRDAIGTTESLEFDRLEPLRLSDEADLISGRVYARGPAKGQSSRGARRRGPGTTKQGSRASEEVRAASGRGGGVVFDPRDGLAT